MIVSESNVHDALKYLAIDPHPISAARFNLTTAENDAKRIYAEALLESDGSADIRKSRAEVNEEYRAAREREANALRDLERHRARIRAAEMMLEIWRTENANARAAERIR